MASSTSVAPGWYRDGVTAGVVRYFDGTAWTEHTAPDPELPVAQRAPLPGQPTWQQPQEGWPTQAGDAAAAEGSGTGPSSVMHWLVPVGRSWQSIVAGYLGLFALVIWILGPVAIGIGIWALVKAQSGGHGRGRAVFGILGGLAGTGVILAFAFASFAA